ncbi:MAG: hypothetical protein PHX18_05150 [Candidatus Gastranaerophilales bacterium]|nr:hypothetical protein [Candidatus Gastranaerophilales bacterium]
MSINSVNNLLNYMESTLEKSKTIPLTSYVVVDKEDLFDLIDKVRSVLPKEIQEANSIIKRKDEINREAQTTAEEIISEAKKEAIRRIDQHEILEGVKTEAEKIKEETISERDIIREKTIAECMKLKKQVITEVIAIREGADRYAQSVFGRLVDDMQELQAIVSAGQNQLGKLKDNSEQQIAYYKSIYDSGDLTLSQQEG